MLTLTHVWLCAIVWYTASAQTAYLNLNEGEECDRQGSQISICKSINDCPKSKKDVETTGKIPEICNFRGRHPVICCAPTTSYISNTEVQGTKSKQMCKKYAESVFTYLRDPVGGGYHPVDLCALGVIPLMIGGTNSTPKEFPHMALIGYGSRNNKVWSCGGSLISERFVLSAAHCSNTYKRGSAKWALLGEYNKDSTDDENNGMSKPTLYTIDERINHPEYKDGSGYHDISLFRLNRDVEFNEFIRPICLHTDYEVSESSGVVTGWGQVGDSGPVLPEMQKANLTLVISKEDCRRSYNTRAELLRSGIDDKIMFCAGNSYHDTCPGDSGGPLQLRLADPYCMYTQIGIVSLGEHCGTKPGIYTRVSHYIPWIESIVWP